MNHGSEADIAASTSCSLNCQHCSLQAEPFPRACPNATQAAVSGLPMTCVLCLCCPDIEDAPLRSWATDQSLELRPRHLAMFPGPMNGHILVVRTSRWVGIL